MGLERKVEGFDALVEDGDEIDEPILVFVWGILTGLFKNQCNSPEKVLA